MAASSETETVLTAKRLHELLDELLLAGAPLAFIIDAISEVSLKTQAYHMRGETRMPESLAGHNHDLLTSLKDLLAAVNGSQAARVRAIRDAREIISRAEGYVAAERARQN